MYAHMGNSSIPVQPASILRGHSLPQWPTALQVSHANVLGLSQDTFALLIFIHTVRTHIFS